MPLLNQSLVTDPFETSPAERAILGRDEDRLVEFDRRVLPGPRTLDAQSLSPVSNIEDEVSAVFELRGHLLGGQPSAVSPSEDDVEHAAPLNCINQH